MSDELRKDEEPEVEAHMPKKSANLEPHDEGDDEVEAHVRRALPKKSLPRKA